jgi:NADH:ubiquinone oxidoreductase subunit K
MVPIEHVLIFSAALFAIGAYGVMARRNAVLVLMAIELMLNAVAVNLVAFGTLVYPGKTSGRAWAWLGNRPPRLPDAVERQCR